MFACPHCGHGGSDISMTMSLDDEREHAFNQQMYRNERGNSWFHILVMVLSLGTVPLICALAGGNRHSRR